MKYSMLECCRGDSYTDWTYYYLPKCSQQYNTKCWMCQLERSWLETMLVSCRLNEGVRWYVVHSPRVPHDTMTLLVTAGTLPPAWLASSSHPHTWVTRDPRKHCNVPSYSTWWRTESGHNRIRHYYKRVHLGFPTWYYVFVHHQQLRFVVY